MINTKDNIWVEGFDTKIALLTKSIQLNDRNIIYSGKTSDIPEEIARKCVINGLHQWPYYSDYYFITKGHTFNTAKDAIQSVFTKPDGTIYPFCLIFKKMRYARTS